MNDPRLQHYVDKDRGWIHEAFMDGVYWAESHPEDNTDWQQVRIQAAIAALQGLLSNEDMVRTLDAVCRSSDEVQERAARVSIKYADALVKELKGKE